MPTETRDGAYTAMRESETEALRRELKKAREELKVALRQRDKYRRLVTAQREPKINERKLRSVK